MSFENSPQHGETTNTPSTWTRPQADGISRASAQTTAIIYPPASPIDPDLHLWDTWWLRSRDGSVAEIDGYRVIFALTASSSILPGKRHDVATLRYFYSADGRSWETGGEVFAESEPFGSRQWAGSAMYDETSGSVFAYYTAAGRRGEAELSYTQRLALGRGGTIETDDAGLTISGPWSHSILLEADGEYYETESQSQELIYTFRDPWFVEHEDSTYLLFEANKPVSAGSPACDGDPAHQAYNGAIGIAESPTGDPTAFELRPPILHSTCVNQELERPHIVRRDGRVYLFVSSHRHTFAPGVEGFDGLYGFVAESIFGPYEPLNGSGLVLTNPSNAPFQAYSWLVYDHGDELLVNSFFNYYDFDRPSLDDIALLSEAEQQRRFGGTPAPTVRLGITGSETWILGSLDHGHLPLPEEPLPETPYHRETSAADQLPRSAYR